MSTALLACSPQVTDMGDGFGPGSKGKDGPAPPPVAGISDDWGIEPTRLDYFEPLLRGDAQWQSLCQRGNQDRVSKFFCQTPRSEITSLDQLITGLGLRNAQGQMLFAISGHSSSLVTTKTSVLNPRAIIFTAPGTPDYVAMGFVRGDGFAELAAFDPLKQDINFFVVKIHKACDPECSNFERFSPEAERNWQGVTVYNDQDLKNTPLDCLQCHQPGGVTARRMLRMQELQDPWTHWFRDNRPSVALLNTFQEYHPGEDYAGIPAARIPDSDPADLEDFVRAAGFDLQPNEFQTDQIATELQQNPTAVPPTWMAQFQKSLDGNDISTPFYMISPYDEAKVDELGAKYAAIMAGTLAPSEMPDMTEMFRDDAMGYLGFRAADGLDAAGVIKHRCGTCHNGDFPGISRNNFDVADFPNNLTPEMKAKILQRITLPETSRLRMPPLMFSKLTPDQIGAIQTELE